LILQRELQDCHGQYVEVILKNAGTLLALSSCRQSPPGGAAMPTTAEEYRAKARECEQRAEKERDPSIKRPASRRSTPMAGSGRIMWRAKRGSRLSWRPLSIIISTGLSQFEFLQPIPIRDLRIPAHRGTHM
jgi:hypothetical protein